MPSDPEASDRQIVCSVVGLILGLAPDLNAQEVRHGQAAWPYDKGVRDPDAPLREVESAVTTAYGAIQRAGQPWQQCSAMEKAIIILVEDGLSANQAVAVATVDALAPAGGMTERVMSTLLRRVFGIENEEVRALLVQVLHRLGEAGQ